MRAYVFRFVALANLHRYCEPEEGTFAQFGLYPDSATHKLHQLAGY